MLVPRLRLLATACAAVGVIGLLRSARAGDGMEKSAVERDTWDGYLWRDDSGRVRIGTPLVGEQFMEGDPRVLPADFAKTLEPLLGPANDVAFHFAFALARSEPTGAAEWPRVLVRLRGVVARTDDRSLRLDDARLVAVEVLDDSWLTAWRPLFTDERSPWRGQKDAEAPTLEARKAYLAVEKTALAAMRAAPSPTPQGTAFVAAKKIDAEVVLFAKFRRRVEGDAARSIAAEAKALDVAADASGPPVPPGPWAALAWIVEAPTKASFLARAAREWKGDATDLDVGHYDVDRGQASRWYAVADLATIRDAWTDAGYARRRAATIEVEHQR